MQEILQMFAEACVAKFENADMSKAAKFVQDFSTLTADLDPKIVDKFRRGMFLILK